MCGMQFSRVLTLSLAEFTYQSFVLQSNIPTCTAANAVFDVRKDYPEQFTDCPNAEYWLEDVGGEFVFALCVPKSYLGPEITDPAIEVGCNCDRIQSQQAMCKTD
jgi:hypothetical protein